MPIASKYLYQGNILTRTPCLCFEDEKKGVRKGEKVAIKGIKSGFNGMGGVNSVLNLMATKS